VLVVNAATKAWTALTKTQVLAQKALNLAMKLNPIGLVVTALAGLAGGLVYAYKKSETFRNIVNGAFGAVKTTITFVWNWIKKNWPLLLGILTGPIGIAVLTITKNWDRIKAGATAVKDWISDKFNAVLNFFRGLPARMGRAVSGLFDGIKDAFRGAINFVIDGWNGLSFSLPGVSIAGKEVFGGTTISTPDIDRLAQGGIVPRTPGGRLAVIGEGRFNEAVVPMDGRPRIVASDRVIPLPNTGNLSAPDLALEDAPGLPDRLARPVHVHLEVDGREMGQVILDQFEQLAARR
jgi:phage-related protein